MPLLLADENKQYKIIKVQGSEEIITRLRNLGFVPNAFVSILQKTKSGFIVKLYESRVAIDKSLGSKIEICEA